MNTWVSWMALVAALFWLQPTLHAQTNHAVSTRTLVLVLGAAGELTYGEQFSAWSEAWKQAATRGGLQLSIIGQEQESPEQDRTRLLTVLSNEVARSGGELWLVFIGHGTFDDKTAKFNLRGPDISAGDLAEVMKPCTRPLTLIQCASASSPFMNALAGPGRVIITATRSGHEINATRFGGYLARAIGDPAADLDKDGQTSVLEAYLLASRQVERFYQEEGRLATEHPLLDDNGDGLGTPPDWFRGVRATKSATDGKSVDGVKAHQMHLVHSLGEQELSEENRTRRNDLEQKLSDLRLKKAAMPEVDYYRQLETLLIEIARLYGTKPE